MANPRGHLAPWPWPCRLPRMRTRLFCGRPPAWAVNLYRVASHIAGAATPRGFAMSMVRAVPCLLLPALLAPWSHAQPGGGDVKDPPAFFESLPDGARLRLGSSGLSLGEAVIGG